MRRDILTFCECRAGLVANREPNALLPKPIRRVLRRMVGPCGLGTANLYRVNSESEVGDDEKK
jgi:hypothetical protein